MQKLKSFVSVLSIALATVGCTKIVDENLETQFTRLPNQCKSVAFQKGSSDSLCVDPQSSYLLLSASDKEIKEPGRIKLEGSIERGDFIEIRKFGSFSHATGQPDQKDGMVGLFLGKEVPFDEFGSVPVCRRNVCALPTKLSATKPVRTENNRPDNKKTDIKTDFFIEKTFTPVQVPPLGNYLYLSAMDSYFYDNSTRRFGIDFNRLNYPPQTKKPVQSNELEPDELSDEKAKLEEYKKILRQLHRDRVLNRDLEIQTGITRPPEYTPWFGSQYRGWYPLNGWKVNQSKWLGPRKNGKKHCGIDLFIPQYTPLTAPGTGGLSCNTQRDKKNGKIAGWGLYASLNNYMEDSGEYINYTLIFAHLSECDASKLTITKGEVFGKAGCTGNADALCGGPSDRTKKSDHVHIEMFIARSDSGGEAIRDTITRPNPLAYFKFRPPKYHGSGNKIDRTMCPYPLEIRN